MARRNVLNGTSDWEREERATQQRDYAAQLQQQVQLKLAKQEQEKAIRKQEQRQELEMMERERAVSKPARKQQTQPAPQLPSPQRSDSMPKVDSQIQGASVASPMKAASTDPSLSSPWPTMAEYGQPTSALVAYDVHVPAFNSAPSIFESVLREPGIGARSISFYEDLASLQRLSAELESAAKLRRTKGQNNYVKPNFLQQQEVSAELSPVTVSQSSPVKANNGNVRSGFQEKQVKQDGNQLESQHAVPQFRTQLDGLLGESVLLPLSKAIPTPPKTLSHARTASQSTRFSVSSPHRFISDGKAENEVEDDTTEALDSHSEMLQF